MGIYLMRSCGKLCINSMKSFNEYVSGKPFISIIVDFISLYLLMVKYLGYNWLFCTQRSSRLEQVKNHPKIK